MVHNYFVYIMGNTRPTLYVGVTRNLVKRVYEHKQKKVEGFTAKYSLVNLLYYEVFENVLDAIEREKQLKHWQREWKLRLIKEKNPELRDLYSDILC